MIKVLYYYYYLFYENILKDNQPHLLATLALSFSFSLVINGIVDISMAHFFQVSLSKYIMILILLLIITIFYFSFHNTGKANEIVKEKPMFFNNHSLSKFLVILFFVITSSFLFWESGYVGNLLGTR